MPKRCPTAGWYFDLLPMEKHRIKDSTPMTPAMSLIFALDFQLDRILAEGLDARFARHAAMSKKYRIGRSRAAWNHWRNPPTAPRPW